MYLALGEATCALLESDLAGAQSLQVLSGRSELPDRVLKASEPDPLSARHSMRPQRAALPASWTGDS